MAEVTRPHTGRITPMRDSQTGDVYDFGKYGLLRALAGNGLRLGVVWYLNVDSEPPNADGGQVDSVSDGSIDDRACDPELFEGLRAILRDQDRRVGAIRERGILPAGTIFYEAPLAFSDLPGSPVVNDQREQRRRSWCLDALDTVSEADLVFLDPDDGLTRLDDQACGRHGPAYAADWEPFAYLSRGQSLIIHHRFQNSTASVGKEVQGWLNWLRNEETGIEPWAFLYHRQHVQVYFVVPTLAHRATVLERSGAFTNTQWFKRHFSSYWLPRVVKW